MIEGPVNECVEVTISLILHSSSGEEHGVEAIVDTGFTGHLHVFDVYIGTLAWNGQVRTVEVDEADTDPLVGMELLRNHSLSVDVVDDGPVRIEALA